MVAVAVVMGHGRACEGLVRNQTKFSHQAQPGQPFWNFKLPKYSYQVPGTW
jgi:hypothetical protein